MTRETYSSTDLHAAIWVATRTLPTLIMLGDAYKSESPRLESAYRRYQEWGNPPSNWYGATTLTSDAATTEDHFYIAYLKEHYPDELRFNIERRARADAYVHLVEELSSRWRFARSYGPYVIHSVVRSTVTFGPNRLEGPSFVTGPKPFSVRFEVDGFAKYDEGKIEQFFPNALRPYQPEGPLPRASWADVDEHKELQLTVGVRDLADLHKFMPLVLRAVSEKTGLPMRKSRRDAYTKLGRDVRWMYLHHCEAKTLEEIAEVAYQDGQEVDSSGVHKAISKVRWLLSNPDMRLS